MSESKNHLTRSQLLVWLGQQQSPDAPLYNMVITFEIPTALNVDLFRRAYREFVADCDALRTVFEEHVGQPYRRVLDRMDFEFRLIDFSHHDDPESAYAEWFKRRQGLPFDLARCAFDTALIQLSPGRFIWYLNQHHIITDGRSVSLVFEATAMRYQALSADNDNLVSKTDTEVSPALKPSPSFEDYAAYEHRLEGEGRIELAQHYWQQQSKLWQALDRPCFYGHAQHHITTASDRYQIKIGPVRGKTLRALATSQQFGALSADVTLFQILLTVLFAYLYRITGETVLVVGAPSANRTNARQRETVGLLMQVFSLRVEIEANDTFRSLHRKVQAESLNFLRYASPGAASPESARAFNLVLNYAKLSSLSLGEVAVQQRFHHAGHGEAHHLLRLQVQDFDNSGELLLELDLNRGAFGYVAGPDTAEHFISTLDAFLSNIDSGLDEYELLSATERQLLLGEMQQTTVEYAGLRPLNELFEAAVEAHPERLAVVSEQFELSYLELDRRVNHLAADLAQAGVGNDDIVGLILHRDTELIIAMLAVLKVGAAYMPIDVNTPPTRRDCLLDVGKVRVIISTDTLQAEVCVEGRIRLVVNARSNARIYKSGNNTATIDSPAYVLFTSGSTGEPKGVVCKHRGVVNLLEDFEQRHSLQDDIHCAWWTSASFDVSVYEIYSALTVGRTLYIVPESARADGRRFLEWLSAKRIQSAYAPPFMLNEISALLEDGSHAPALRRLLVGVEPIAEETLARIARGLPNLQIINGYGPTEATICTTLYSLPQGSAPDRNTPIGRPVRNTSLYLLDQSMGLTPFGAVGEIYVGGDGLACGYLNRPDLTAASFVTNPFDSDSQARLYKTGDLARYLPDGNLMFLGRGDDQIKLRGQRIEPGEVERALVAHPAVRDVLAIATQGEGDKQLIAYIVTHAPTNASGLDWLKWLETRLPRFMIPSAFIILDAFPLTTSGKIDRGALPSPAKVDRVALPTRAPETPLEHTLAEIFGAVLELPSIDVDAHFLELGGDSIHAMLIATRACESGLQLAPLQIFEAGSISALASVLDGSPGQERTSEPGSGKPVSASEMEDVVAEFGEDLDDDPGV